MIYFDTDVLIHILLPQDLAKHEFANRLYWKSTEKKELFVSLLCLQETGFVLQKLAQQPEAIERMLASLMHYQPVAYEIRHFKRAIALARKIGFQNINDCLHTAIAEDYCDELYTFNKADFKRISKHTPLKITIL
jgi:predicted nucleic acid-binding protein